MLYVHIVFLCIFFRAKTYAAPVSCEYNRKIIESEVLLFNQNVALKYKDGQKYNYRISLLWFSYLCDLFIFAFLYFP